MAQPNGAVNKYCSSNVLCPHAQLFMSVYVSFYCPISLSPFTIMHVLNPWVWALHFLFVFWDVILLRKSLRIKVSPRTIPISFSQCACYGSFSVLSFVLSFSADSMHTYFNKIMVPFYAAKDPGGHSQKFHYGRPSAVSRVCGVLLEIMSITTIARVCPTMAHENAFLRKRSLLPIFSNFCAARGQLKYDECILC